MLMVHDTAKTDEDQNAIEEKKKLRKSLKHGNTLTDLKNAKTGMASIKSKRDEVPYKSDGDALKLFKNNSVIPEENNEDDGDSVNLSQEDDDDMVNMKDKINVNDIDDVERQPTGDSLAKQESIMDQEYSRYQTHNTQLEGGSIKIIKVGED